MDYVTIGLIGGIAFSLALATQVINKLMINEKQVDQMNVDMKSMQKELKTLDPKSKEFSQKQEKMLDINLSRMKMQFKPMMITFLPYILIFYVISGMFSFAPIMVGSTVDVLITGEGHVYSECLGLDQDIDGKLEKQVTIGSEGCIVAIGDTETEIALGGSEPISFSSQEIDFQMTPPEKEYIPLPVSLPLVGDSLGWLGVFITFSFSSSMILSKLLKGKYLRKWE